MKKGQDGVSGENAVGIMGIEIRWDHDHIPKNYITHSNWRTLELCSITEKIQCVPIHALLSLEETL